MVCSMARSMCTTTALKKGALGRWKEPRDELPGSAWALPPHLLSMARASSLGAFGGWIMSSITSAGFAFCGNAVLRCFWKLDAASAAEPAYTREPPVASKTSSLKRQSVSKRGWWMTLMTVVPWFSAALLRQPMTSCAVVLSRPLVGSSAKSSRGRVTNSMAMETRFRWPPDIPRCSGVPTRALTMADRLRSFATCCTDCRRSLAEVPAGSRKLAWKRMLSSTVNSPWRMSSCGTNPVTCLRKPKSCACSPPTNNRPVTRPYEAWPLSTAKRVDLPLPEGPMTATRLPAMMLRSMPFSNCAPSGKEKPTS
mmetsp:Transcript_72457/g.223917  ORF Transcript_72457/g.223917 Transcript_72457/m.223917 type:complete len:310 (-) Transcript_72457:953-1882(-)